MKSLIAVILDESGSMEPRSNDVIGGFNAFINQQKQEAADEVRFYLVKFNSRVSVAIRDKPLDQVPRLDNNSYIPGSGTALYDAIAETIGMIKKDKKKDERVLCVIMTDGQENESKKTSKQEVIQMIANKEAKGDWTFLYIGEDPEGWSKEMSKDTNSAIPFDDATMENFSSISSAVSAYRSSDDIHPSDLFNSPYPSR